MDLFVGLGERLLDREALATDIGEAGPCSASDLSLLAPPGVGTGAREAGLALRLEGNDAVS